MEYLDELKEAIAVVHGCKATHTGTTPVKEVFQGKTAWDGDVEAFDIAGHAKAKRCYAWGFPDESRDGKLEIVTVLEIPPVTSPETAVKAAIANAAQARRN